MLCRCSRMIGFKKCCDIIDLLWGRKNLLGELPPGLYLKLSTMRPLVDATTSPLPPSPDLCKVTVSTDPGEYQNRDRDRDVFAGGLLRYLNQSAGCLTAAGMCVCLIVFLHVLPVGHDTCSMPGLQMHDSFHSLHIDEDLIEDQVSLLGFASTAAPSPVCCCRGGHAACAWSRYG